MNLAIMYQFYRLRTQTIRNKYNVLIIIKLKNDIVVHITFHTTVNRKTTGNWKDI